MEKLFAAVAALKAGQSLKDSATWKNRQILMNILLLILSTAIKFTDINISESDLNSIAYGLATLGVAFNAYFTTATSDKVGI
jgi:hypothetical protein